nr:MAG TPA: hypothetical protein [Caudoviricetes sp.]
MFACKVKIINYSDNTKNPLFYKISNVMLSHPMNCRGR